ncbi:MAG: ketopantoate reductase family protein [Sedimentibacter sp.]
MKVVIIGAGAMGSIYGGFLAEAGNDVYFLDVYKEHVDTINRDGLWIEGCGKDRYIKNIKATSNPEEVGIVDLAVVFVKSTITDLAIEQNKAVVGENTIVLTLQNGLGNIEKLMTVVKEDQIIAGTTAHGSNMLGPGKIKHAGHGATVIGELNGKVTDRIKEVSKLLNDAKLEPVVVSENVMGLIWDKLLVNVGVNPLTAITGLRNGQLLDYPETEWIGTEAVKEGMQVAKAMKIKLETVDAVGHFKDVCIGTAPNISSMLADVNNKRKTEINNINGAIVRLGENNNIETPVNKVLTNLVLLKEKMYNK